jgi:glycosyltransferase involved in cell wall biosynthesis
MNVAIVQDHLRMGGTEKQTLFLASHLREAGHEVCLVIFRPGGSLWGDMLARGVPYKVLQGIDLKVDFLAPGLFEELERMAPDVILCMGRTANCYSGFIQRHFRDVGVIGSLRTGKLIFPLHHWSLGEVSAVLVNSNWWRRRMLQRGFAPERVRLVHNPMMLRVGQENRELWRRELRQKAGAGEDTCVFVDVASFRPGKRHAELIGFFARFAEHTQVQWQLWLVGSGREIEKCRRLARQAGIGERVLFFGQQAYTGPFYAGADVAVSASREDSLPNFLIEAQAMALPLVAVDCRGVEECCIPDRTGLVVPPDCPTLFAEALERAATDAALRETTHQTAPSFVAERFGAERQAALTTVFLEEIAASKGAKLSRSGEVCIVREKPIVP